MERIAGTNESHWMPPREANEKSEAAARKAVELDDSLPEAHNTLAML
jgi:tetratricopeptide (TPR) repeat protein